MPRPTSRVGTAAITENLLKRKWSVTILRYLHQGIHDHAEIIKLQPEISAKSLSERFRAMLRYGVVARFPRPPPSAVVEYRLTALGSKLLEMLNTIEELDQQL